MKTCNVQCAKVLTYLQLTLPSLIQVSMWLLAVGVGMVFGKTIIHGILLSRFLRLKMFRADQVIMLLSTKILSNEPSGT